MDDSPSFFVLPSASLPGEVLAATGMFVLLQHASDIYFAERLLAFFCMWFLLWSTVISVFSLHLSAL